MVPPMILLVEQVVVAAVVVDLPGVRNRVAQHQISLEQLNKVILAVLDLIQSLEQETAVAAAVPVLSDKIALLVVLLHQDMVVQVFKF